MKRILFSPGKILATPAAIELMVSNKVNPSAMLLRHLTGDWGNLSPDDIAENWLSVREGFRILSSYSVNGSTLWLITENDRSATTFLLPEDY
jgi:hypothetical protein